MIGLVLYSLLYIIAWQVDLSLFLNPLVTYPAAILLFVLGVLSQLETRKNTGGFISFNTAIVVFIITIAIALLGALITNLLIFNVFEPSAKIELQEIALQEALAMMDKMGEIFGIQEEMGAAMDEEVLREAMEQQDMMGISSLFISFISSLAIFTVGGLISAAIIKRNAPIQFD